MEILPEVLRNYGRAVQFGNCNIYQSLPRMLTIWFEYGDYCYANVKHADNRVRPPPHITRRREQCP
jgi:serine/threonine-protein kinase ATR